MREKVRAPASSPRRRARQSRGKLAELQLRLEEAEATLRAIRSGQVDSLVVDGPGGPRVYALEGVNDAYRVLVEAMSEGAASLSSDGTILYCNSRLAAMVGEPLSKVMGSPLLRFIAPNQRRSFEALMAQGQRTESRAEVELRRHGSGELPVMISLSPAGNPAERTLCLIATDLSAQKRSEEILAAGQLAQLVLDQAAEAIIVCDAQGMIMRASDATLDLCGQNVLLRSFDEAFPIRLGSARVRKQAQLASGVAGIALSGKSLRAQPGGLVCGDGKELELLVSAAPLRGPTGGVNGCVITLADITETRRAEEAIRVKEARLRAFFNNSALGVVELDTQGRFTDMNQRYCEIIGYSSKELLQMAAADLTVPENRACDAAFIATKIAEGSSRYEQEKECCRKDGRRVWVRVAGSVICDESGCPTRVVGIIEDITARVRAEADLRESEMRMRTIIENSRDGINLLDLRTGRYVLMSPAQMQLTGFSADEMGNLPVEEAWARVHPDDREISVAQQRRVATGEDVGPVEYRWRVKSGEYRWFSDSRKVIRDEAGRAIALVGVSRDITERKLAEQALREADRNKNHFIAVLSHELRNPLAPIRNSLYVLERLEPNEEQAVRARAVIKRQVGYMARLIDDLLDVTRISQGKIQLQRSPMDLGEVVRRTVEDFRLGFEAADIRLQLSGCDEHLSVDGDPTRLAQVVGNLLHNASKFTQRGGRVSVALERDLASSQAVIRVADNGAGISPEILQRLFQPFVQADSSMDRVLGGLGLGLSLVKGIVDLHGGQVSVHSPGPGQGSEFMVRLPLGDDSGKVNGIPPQQVARACRVLVIEDNIDAAQSLRDVLELSSNEVAVAHNGPDGLELARRFLPEVVLCDIGLPGMDGYQVARTFKADETLRGAFLVALSGYAMPEDLQRAVEAGFARHMAKPPNLEQLEALIRERAAVGLAQR